MPEKTERVVVTTRLGNGTVTTRTEKAVTKTRLRKTMSLKEIEDLIRRDDNPSETEKDETDV